MILMACRWLGPKFMWADIPSNILNVTYQCFPFIGGYKACQTSGWVWTQLNRLFVNGVLYCPDGLRESGV